jgi:hypothetical protein
MSLVNAINQWSCALACIVSICDDKGIKVTQDSIIKDYKKDFPQWDTQPGVLNDEDLIKLADKLNLTSPNKSRIEKNFSEDYFREKYSEDDTVGILIGTHKFYDSSKKLIENQHCLRLIRIVNDDFYLMNPSIQPPEEKYKWKEIKSFDATAIILKF